MKPETSFFFSHFFFYNGHHLVVAVLMSGEAPPPELLRWRVAATVVPDGITSCQRRHET